MLIEHMGKGHSFESFGAVIDVHRDTLYEWAKEKVHPEFSDAKKRGKEKLLYFLEEIGIEGMWGVKKFNSKGMCIYSKQLNSTAFIWFTKNTVGWKDNPETKEDEEKTPSIKMNYAKSK